LAGAAGGCFAAPLPRCTSVTAKDKKASTRLAFLLR
jgi:hypothetical protein